MPESVKITDLPELSTVVPNDIIVVVDENETQTGRATLQQVKNLDSGPNSVKEFSIATGAATASKVGFSGPDKIISRSATGAGGGEEFPCSPYSRGLLAAADGPAARAYLDALQTTADPTFTGQVRIPAGTEALPSLVYSGNTETGMYFPTPSSIGMSMNGMEFARFVQDGTILSRTNSALGPSLLLPQYSVRAWARFNGGTGAATTLSNPHDIAARYGFWGQSMWYETNTINKIIEIETAWGNTVTSYGTVQADGRSNYTSPYNNVHVYWTGSAWATIGATGRSWIGSITLTPNPNITMFGTGNITAIKSISTGVYEFTLATPMPDTNYAVLVTSNRNAHWNGSGDQPVNRTVNTFRIKHVENSAVAVSNDISVIVIR